MEDMDRTRQVYHACLDILPHKKFTFAKIWLMLAQFEIRQKNLNNARKVLVSEIMCYFTFIMRLIDRELINLYYVCIGLCEGVESLLRNASIWRLKKEAFLG